MSDERRLSDQELELLSAYLDGALAADERSRLEARLQADPRLRRELSILRKTVELVKVVPPVKAPRDFTVTREMLRARPPRVLIFPATTLVSTLSAVAAMLFVALGLLLLTSRAPTMPGVESGAESSVQDSQIAALPTQATYSVQLEATPEPFEPDADAAAGIVIQATTGAQPPDHGARMAERDEAAAASEAEAETANAVEDAAAEMETFSEEAVEEAAPASETLDTFAQSEDNGVFDRTNVPPAMPMPDAMQIPQGRGGAGGAADSPEMGGGGGEMGGADMGVFAGEAPDMAPQADTLMQQDAAVEAAAAASPEMEASTSMEAAAPAEAPMMEMAQVASPTTEPIQPPTATVTMTPTSTPTESPTNTPAPTPTATPIPAAIPLPEGTAGIIGVLLVISGILAFGLFAMTLRARRGH